MIRHIFISLLSLFAFSVPVYSAAPVQPAAQPAAQPAVSEVAGIIAPLVDEQTYLIVHINLKEVEFDKILEKTIMFFESELMSHNENIDASAMTRIRMNLVRSYNHIVREFREIRERLVNDAGVDDIFLVAYTDMISQVPFVLAAESKDKTAEQRKAFARIVKGAFPIMFPDHGFMIAATPNTLAGRDEVEAKFRARIKDIKPVGKPYLKLAFSQQEGNAITVVAILPPDISAKITSIPRSGNAPNRLLDLAKFASERLQWVTAGINVQNESAQVILQAKTNKAANEVIAAVKGTTDLVFKDSRENPSTRLTPAQLADRLKKVSEQFSPVLKDDTQLVLMIDRSKTVAFELTMFQLVLWLKNAQAFTWANQCSFNLKTISFAINKYREEKGEYPPAWTTDPLGKPLHSWRVLILPYLDEEDLYKSIRLDEPWDSEHNRQFHTKMPTIFRCPACVAATNSTTTYAMIVGPDTFHEGPKALKIDELTDSADATIQIVERKNAITWMKPEEILQADAYKGVGVDRGIGSNHPRPGAHAVFFDSTVRYIVDQVPLVTLRGIISQRGGEKIELP